MTRLAEAAVEFVGAGAFPTLLALQLLLAVTFVLTAAWILDRCLRGASAAARHLVWGTALAATLFLPVGAVSPVHLEVPLPEWAAVGRPAGEAGGPNGAAGSEATPAGGAGGSSLSHPDVPARAAGAGAESAPEPPATRAAPTDDRVPDPVPGGTLTLAWLAGSLFLLGCLALEAVGLRVLRARGREVEMPGILRLVEELSVSLGLEGGVSVLRSRSSHPPVAWGVLDPVVLLPAGATAWDERRLRSVLAHELAHLRRRDQLWCMVGRVATALYWFHPLVWMGDRRMAEAAELAADREALGCGIRGSEYADVLLGLATGLRTRPGFRLLAFMGGRRPRIAERIETVLVPGHRPSWLEGRWRGVPAAAVGLLGVALAGFRGELPPSAREAPPLAGHVRPATSGERPPGAPASVGTASASSALAPASACWNESDLDRNTNRNEEDGLWTAEWTSPSCRSEIGVRGAIHLTPDERGVARMSSRAWIRIRESGGGRSRELRVSGTPDGRPRWSFRVDGVQASVGSPAFRSWLGERLETMLEEGAPLSVP